MIDLAIARAGLLDETTFEHLRAAVPIERQFKSDRFHRQEDRYTSVVAFSLLQYLWQERVGIPLPEVVLGTFGKPQFQGPCGWHFNWSHDDSVCACALAPMPIGVDVQSRIPFDEGLFEQIAAQGERRYRDRFFREDDLSPLWTRKESVVKRTGLGLTTPLRNVDTLATADIATFSYEMKDVHLSISAEGLSEQTLLSRLRIRDVRPNPGSAGWRATPGEQCLRYLAMRSS
ncbi:4'-phosphopantetheinyl transferase superfamily protein [Glycomyces sp. L485]|uniref:4'-phosphopantetheinyl transferase family protein n=1 Tax=Glycomyces sp. L485 TaxID=2909235 RepID=UPI001F4AB682|nr:4'-phosphopantetheinyl transferase superfamily protein [Glycomyces sp. L485]MCH7231765.1 4'-phosphopantetheinyl transferase superfamily protein [Glycomyces sp. L485]